MALLEQGQAAIPLHPVEPQSDVGQGGRHPPPLPNRNMFLVCIGPGEGARSFPVHLSRKIAASPESAGICDMNRNGYSLRSTTPLRRSPRGATPGDRRGAPPSVGRQCLLDRPSDRAPSCPRRCVPQFSPSRQPEKCPPGGTCCRNGYTCPAVRSLLVLLSLPPRESGDG